jgi:hypothetical protein
MWLKETVARIAGDILPSLEAGFTRLTAASHCPAWLLSRAPAQRPAAETAHQWNCCTSVENTECVGEASRVAWLLREGTSIPHFHWMLHMPSDPMIFFQFL